MKIDVISKESIENVNCAMIFSLESKHRIVGTEYIVEDGRITSIVEKDKIITER